MDDKAVANNKLIRAAYDAVVEETNCPEWEELSFPRQMHLLEFGRKLRAMSGHGTGDLAIGDEVYSSRSGHLVPDKWEKGEITTICTKSEDGAIEVQYGLDSEEGLHPAALIATPAERDQAIRERIAQLEGALETTASQG